MTRSIIGSASIFQLTVAQTLKSTLMGLKTPGHYPCEVSHGVMYKVLMGAATVPLVRGTVGCPGEVDDCKQACTWLVGGWVFELKMEGDNRVRLGCKCIIQALELHGCIFPGSSLPHPTMTNGNALCLLMSFIFKHITLTRSYKITYWQYESLQEINYMCKVFY